MKVKIKDVPECKKLLEIEVPCETVNRYLEEVYRDIRKNAVIPGFRKGKAPRDMIVTRYAATARREVLERLVPDLYFQAVEKYDIRPVAYPEISDVQFDENAPLTFKAEVEVHPSVKIRSYLGLKVKEKEIGVTPEEVERVLKDTQERAARYPAVEEDRGVRTGDFLVADMQFLVEGKVIENQKDLWLRTDPGIGIPGFVEQLVGVKKGEEKEVKLTLPEDFPRKEFSGKQAVYKVKVKEIKEKKQPRLDDEFAREVSGCATLEELKKKIENELLERARLKEKDEQKEQVFEELLGKSEFEVPDTVVKRRLVELMKSARIQLLYRGLSNEEIDSRKEEMEKELKAAAGRQVSLYFILQEIARKEGIKAGEREVEERISAIAAARKQNAEQVRKYLEKQGLMESLRDEIIQKKTGDFLLEKAKMVK